MLQRPWQARWDWGNPVSHCTSDLPHWAAHPYSLWFSASLLFLAFCQNSRHLLDNTKNISGMNGLCINIFIYCSERPGFIYLGRGGVSILSREWHLTAVLPEKQSALGHVAQHGAPFTTFAVVLEECVLQPSSCAMENSTSLLVAVSCHAAVWYGSRRQSERKGEEEGLTFGVATAGLFV